MTLSQKILAGFLVCTVILIATAIFAIRNNEKYNDTTQWVNHTYEVLQEFDGVQAAAVDAETGTRGFVISGTDNFLEPYVIARTAITEHLNKVKSLTADNAIQQQNIAVLQGQLNIEERYFEDLIDLRRKDFEKAKDIVAAGKGKQLMDDVRKTIVTCKEMENKLLLERKQASAEDGRSFNIVFIALLIVVAVVLISVFIVINTNLRALKKAEQESANNNWLLTGNFELNEKTRGERTETELAQAIITQLCTYLNTQIGAMYLFDNGELKLTGTYAYNFRKQNTTVIKPGEGLVGQAAS